MNQGVVIRSLILLLLLHQTSTGVWYYFDDDGDDVEFKLDEVDSTYDSDYPNGACYVVRCMSRSMQCYQ